MSSISSSLTRPQSAPKASLLINLRGSRPSPSMGAMKSKIKVSVLTVGLDNSGKTTVLNKMNPQKGATDVTPTVGFNVEEFTKKNFLFTCIDMSGHYRYRNLWEQYYESAQGLVFVIDAADEIRFPVVQSELKEMLQHPALANNKCPLLFMANKMDLPAALTHMECADKLELDQIKDREWQIIATNALAGDGIEQGINWLADHMKK